MSPQGCRASVVAGAYYASRRSYQQLPPYEVFRVTDPSSDRDGESDAREPDAATAAETTEEATDGVDDAVGEDATDGAIDDEVSDDDADLPEDEPEPDDEPSGGSAAKSDSVRDRPAASGKASRSGNPARAAEAEGKGRKTRPVKPQRIGNRWAAPAMLTSAAIGLIWIVLYYVFANGDNPIPVMDDLGDWNLIIGMGFIVAAFGFSMKWE